MQKSEPGLMRGESVEVSGLLRHKKGQTQACPSFSTNRALAWYYILRIQHRALDHMKSRHCGLVCSWRYVGGIDFTPSVASNRQSSCPLDGSWGTGVMLPTVTATDLCLLPRGLGRSGVVSLSFLGQQVAQCRRSYLRRLQSGWCA